MKVLFSNPPWWDIDPDNSNDFIRGVRAGSRWPHTGKRYLCAPDKHQFGEYLPYPFFMGYAASWCREKTGYEVVLRDSIALSESYQSYFNYLNQFKPDYIVIETATPSWNHDKKVIAYINKNFKNLKVILAGTISSADQEQEILKNESVIALIKGEYEKNVVKVLNGQRGVIQHDLLTLEEMNSAPFPDLNDETWWRYNDCNPRGQLFPHAQIWSSRGCPYKCIFCVWPAVMTGNDPLGKSKRTVRHYTKEYMGRYIENLLSRYDYKSIYFDDDTFNLGNKHTLEMCELMKEVGLPWSAMCRADTIQKDTWRVMKESGCFGVKLGFESGNQYVVDNIVNKHLDLKEAAEVVKYLKEIGMTVHGTFTMGLPGETKEQVQDTLNYINSLPFDSHQLSGTAEIEGTPLSNLKKEGKLEKYSGAEINEEYKPEHDGGLKARNLAKHLKNN